MEGMWVQRQASHLRVGHHDAGRIATLVQLRLDSQASRRSGVANQRHDGFKRPERTPAPVLCDVAEEAVFDLVPLAGARREMRDVDAEAEVIRDALEARFPRWRAIRSAAARFCRVEARRSVWLRASANRRRTIATRE